MARVTYQKITPEDYQPIQDSGTWEPETQYFLTNGIIYCNGMKMTPDEEDPTVPSWAKTPTKPNYTADEVGAVDVDNEMALQEIDSMFLAVFGH